MSLHCQNATLLEITCRGSFAFNVSVPFNFDGCWLFQSEVEETLKRIQSHRGVIGVIIVNNEGKSFRG